MLDAQCRFAHLVGYLFLFMIFAKSRILDNEIYKMCMCNLMSHFQMQAYNRLETGDVHLGDLCIFITYF